MKPRKSFLILPVILFLFSISGCAMHRDFYPYYDSPQEVYEQNTNPVLWKKVADLEKENQIRKEADAVWNSKFSSFQASLFKIDVSLGAMAEQLRQLNAGLPTGNINVQQVDGAKREMPGKTGVSMEGAAATAGTAAPAKKGVVAAMQDEMADYQQRLKKLEEDSRKAQKDIENATLMPSIVVVSGTGKEASAKKMALMLSRLGYRVDRIAETPQKGYNKNVVFYKEPHREAAAKLASRIGGKTIIKPMDWQSKYGIAVISVLK